jgi:hypothetical protein
MTLLVEQVAAGLKNHYEKLDRWIANVIPTKFAEEGSHVITFSLDSLAAVSDFDPELVLEKIIAQGFDAYYSERGYHSEQYLIVKVPSVYL